MKDENKAYAEFLKALVSFSLDLLKKTEAGAGENTLVSPLSVCLALAMAANGADGETLAQMEKVLGLNLDLDSLNLSLSTFVKNLKQGEKAKFQFANSLWLKKGEGLTVDEDFLKRNDEFYRAEVFLENFDNETLEKINEWVKRNTQGLIDKILDEIQDDSLMYLINALAFDASWRKVYDLKDIYDRDFKSLKGDLQRAKFMHSKEHTLLNDGKAMGFLKPYAQHYSFMALLPNEDVDFAEYVAGLEPESFVNTLDKAGYADIEADIPKFKVEFKVELGNILEDMGMPLAFDPEKADFSKMGKLGEDYDNLYIGRVIHKTYIALDELGTKAGAVTAVEMVGFTMAARLFEPIKIVLDRPFVYAIIENESGLPIFIGTVTDLG